MTKDLRVEQIPTGGCPSSGETTARGNALEQPEPVRASVVQTDSPRYRTIVVDPPWDHSDGTGFAYGVKRHDGNAYGEPRVTRPPYVAMGLNEIVSLPVDDFAERDAHLYLWTTSRYLHESFHVVESWDFEVSATLVWCKAPMGFMGGAFRSSVEFVQFARRGSLPHKTQAPQRWFTWKRPGWRQSNPIGAHSHKPDAFLDLVESVSPCPYLEMFARRQRLGWDTWGDEALNHLGVA